MYTRTQVSLDEHTRETQESIDLCAHIRDATSVKECKNAHVCRCIGTVHVQQVMLKVCQIVSDSHEKTIILQWYRVWMEMRSLSLVVFFFLLRFRSCFDGCYNLWRVLECARGLLSDFLLLSIMIIIAQLLQRQKYHSVQSGVLFRYVSRMKFYTRSRISVLKRVVING